MRKVRLVRLQLVLMALGSVLLVSWKLQPRRHDAEDSQEVSWLLLRKQEGEFIDPRGQQLGSLDSEVLQKFIETYGQRQTSPRRPRLGSLDSEILQRFIAAYSRPPMSSTPVSTVRFKRRTTVAVHQPAAPAAAPCPSSPIVTAQFGGRLASQLWEYAAVWSLARVLGRPALVPAATLAYLSAVFSNLRVPALEEVSHCRLKLGKPLKRYQLSPLSSVEERYRGKNIFLHRWMVLPEPILLYRDQLRKEFRFLPSVQRQVELTLRQVTGKRKHLVYVGVHVRREGDIGGYLRKEYNASLVDAGYFVAAMAWFRRRFEGQSLVFLVVSDEPQWCERELRARDVTVVAKDRGHDLALLAACNHTIIDYGMFGAWGALIAGGHTVSLQLDPGFDQLVSTTPNWHVWKWSPQNYSSS